jgi:hypothetical protein
MSLTAWVHLVLSSYHAALDQQRGVVLLGRAGIVAMLGEWSTMLAIHCSRIIATCPHVLQALSALPARTSRRLMIVLTSGILETYARAFRTRGSSRTGRPVRLFFMFEICGPQGTAACVAAQIPPSREAGSRATGHATLRSPPSRFRAMIHVVTSEPTLAERWVPEPLDTW